MISQIERKELIKKICMSAMCLALAVILPIAFHAVPNSAVIFSPLHIPVLLCGLICGYKFGLLVGLFGPILSMLISGMPTVSNLPSMIVECLIYGSLPYLYLKIVKFKHLYINIYVSLIISILIGRCAGGIVSALMYTEGNYSLGLWATSYFVKGWPGIIIQIILIPNVVFLLDKSKLIKLENNKNKEINKKEKDINEYEE